MLIHNCELPCIKTTVIGLCIGRSGLMNLKVIIIASFRTHLGFFQLLLEPEDLQLLSVRTVRIKEQRYTHLSKLIISCMWPRLLRNIVCFQEIRTGTRTSVVIILARVRLNGSNRHSKVFMVAPSYLPDMCTARHSVKYKRIWTLKQCI
jgi:hypothetical protein